MNRFVMADFGPRLRLPISLSHKNIMEKKRDRLLLNRFSCGHKPIADMPVNHGCQLRNKRDVHMGLS
ncbi:hypothetical protein CEXT_578191 [Caerostris extrusa]|uniref:Uncharacterized protein n=1 Tax=Caerostris extrusa TaxID=172846 RepID=A0AAV4TBR6_CAEEX|nr:hypothetical protein CEXT_578191 [Caerostris extrusa]